MATGDSYSVEPANLVEHAAHVAALGDEVAMAQQAGTVVRLGHHAYGVICVIVPVMLGPFQGVLVQAIGDAADSLHQIAPRLREAAGGYHATDAAGAARFRKVTGNGATGKW
jgi:DNA-binding IclR family transcriptional regulator